MPCGGRYQVTDGARRQWEWCRTQDAAANAAAAMETERQRQRDRDGDRETETERQRQRQRAEHASARALIAASSPVPLRAGDSGSPNGSHSRSDTVGAVVIDHYGRVAAGAHHDMIYMSSSLQFQHLLTESDG